MGICEFGWRLPNIGELLVIMNSYVNLPGMPNSLNGVSTPIFWSSTEDPGDSTLAYYGTPTTNGSNNRRGGMWLGYWSGSYASSTGKNNQYAALCIQRP